MTHPVGPHTLTASLWIDHDGNHIHVEVRGTYVPGHGPYGFDRCGSGGNPGEPDDVEDVAASADGGITWNAIELNDEDTNRAIAVLLETLIS